LYSCLSLKLPQLAHLPILLNPDGTKMSKRKGDVAVLKFMVRYTIMFIPAHLDIQPEYQKRGWEPEALINWLALAGWGQVA
jgi:glutamyl-tRNA synthetase